MLCLYLYQLDFSKILTKSFYHYLGYPPMKFCVNTYMISLGKPKFSLKIGEMEISFS